MEKQKIGMIGLGVMGQNLALNIEINGFSVCSFDLFSEKLEEAKTRFKGKRIKIVDSLGDLVESLESPKKIWIMVPAGKPVDDVIEGLKPFLTKGDIIIDGGNSLFKDTERRFQQLQTSGIYYIGTGVSGGEEGALLGPSLMA